MRLFDRWDPATPIEVIQDHIFSYYWGLKYNYNFADKEEIESLENYLEYLKTHPYINLRMWDYMTNDPRYRYLDKDKRNLWETINYYANKIGTFGTGPWITGGGIKEYEGYVPKEVFDFPLRPSPENPDILRARHNQEIKKASEREASQKLREANQKLIEQKENRVRDISERELNQLKEQINATQTPGYNPYYDLDNTIFNRYR